MVASLTIIKGIEMEMNLDFWQFVLSGLTLLVAVVGGIVGWFWIKPVDRKLQNIDALSHQFNSRIDTLREAVLNSEIKMREQGYNRMIDACLIVRRALQHLIDTFRILTLCKGLKDIEEIRAVLDDSARMRFSEFLSSYMPKEDCWQHPDILAAQEAELFAPARIWQIYSVASQLLAVLQLQIVSLGLEFDATTIKKDQAYKSVDQVLPGQYDLLIRFGTQWYSAAMDMLLKCLIVEVRKVVGVDPIKVDELVLKNEIIEAELTMRGGVPSEFKNFANHSTFKC